MAHGGLAAALVRLDRHDEAVDNALTAVELLHSLPRAHLRLGVTLVRVELDEHAVEVFQVCLKLAPMTPVANRWLARLYRLRLGQPALAPEHQIKAQETLRLRVQQAHSAPMAGA